MAKMIQVRNVPNRLHRELVRRAKARGESLTRFVQALLEREASRPPVEEVFDQIHRRPAVELDRPVADTLRAERRRGAP